MEDEQYVCAVCSAPVRRGVGGVFFHPGGRVGTIAREVRLVVKKESNDAKEDSRRSVAVGPIPPIEPFIKPSGSIHGIRKRPLQGRRPGSHGRT